MEVKKIPQTEVIHFDQDEVRQTRDIGSKLSGMGQSLGKLVRGEDITRTELDEILKELLETKHEVDKYFEQLFTQVDSLQ